MKMDNCGSMLKSALVVIVVMALVQTGTAAEKLAPCCKKVTKEEITEDILDYMVQPANPPCVQAVIFQTKTGLYCSYVRAPWVRSKIIAIRAAKARASAASSVAPSSPVTLPSITATASPPSSSSLSPSSSSLSPSSSSLSPVSLLSIIISTASPPSSSSLPPSSSSTSETPTGESSSTSSQ